MLGYRMHVFLVLCCWSHLLCRIAVLLHATHAGGPVQLAVSDPDSWGIDPIIMARRVSHLA